MLSYLCESGLVLSLRIVSVIFFFTKKKQIIIIYYLLLLKAPFLSWQGFDTINN